VVTGGRGASARHFTIALGTHVADIAAAIRDFIRAGPNRAERGNTAAG
jgi:hypothetical protein